MSTATHSKKPVIHPFNGKTGLAQIYQSLQLKAAWMQKQADDSFKVINQHVLCYDFLVDQVAAIKQKCHFQIYGYSVSGETQDMNLDTIYLHLIFPNNTAQTNFEKNLTILHQIEAKNKIPKTEFIQTDNLQAMIIGNKKWLQNCVTFRLYLFFFRMMCHAYKDQKNWVEEFAGGGHSDSLYLRHFNRESLNRILNDINSIKTDYFSGIQIKGNVSAYHHNSGVFSVFSKHHEQNPDTVRKNKHYVDFVKRGFKMYITTDS